LGFFRREKLHERLAREGGLNPRTAPEPIYTGPPDPGVPGYHGVQRPRRWDAVVMAEAPDLPGDEVSFVVLAEGSVVLDEELPEPAVEPIAEELDQMVDPPYRVEAVRRHGDVWAAAARRIDLIDLPEVEGEELTLTMQDGSRSLSIDGIPEFGSVPELERLAGEQFDSYVAAATRLDGQIWEVKISPL
jgi:hypothetical protein